MEKIFIDNVVILVSGNTLNWKMKDRTTLDNDTDFRLGSIGPDNKTLLEVKFESEIIAYLKVTNTDLKIDKLIFKSNYPDQLNIIGKTLFEQFKDQFVELSKKKEISEDDKWRKLSQTFDLQTVRDEKLNNILNK